MSAPSAVTFRQVDKHFGHFAANRSVSFEVATGSIHGLIGENGAGKSTAMNMLYGLLQPDAGVIEIFGQPFRLPSPRAAQAVGVGMVHQHSLLAKPFSVLDNILLDCSTSAQRPGTFASLFRPLKRNAVEVQLHSHMERLGFNIDLRKSVNELTVGERQRVEILRLVHKNVRIMIFDEPTAVFTPAEIAQFEQLLRNLKDQGKTIILITHKLPEIARMADRVTVMRRGSALGTFVVPGLNMEELAAMMIGRPPAPIQNQSLLTHAGGLPQALELRSVTLSNRLGRAFLKDVSFSIAPGEILGIAGIEGNGQEELQSLLYNPKHFSQKGWTTSGALSALGKDIKGMWSPALRRLKIGVIPADRHGEAVLLEDSLLDNFALGYHNRRPFARYGWLLRSIIAQHLEAAKNQFHIKFSGPMQAMGELSGGNQQKLVVARELQRNPDLILCSHPTRGVDIGAMELIHQKLLDAKSRGAAILLISSQLEELLQLSDKIRVIYRGTISGEFRRTGGTFDVENIGLLMSGKGSKNGT